MSLCENSQAVLVDEAALGAELGHGGEVLISIRASKSSMNFGRLGEVELVPGARVPVESSVMFEAAIRVTRGGQDSRWSRTGKCRSALCGLQTT